MNNLLSLQCFSSFQLPLLYPVIFYSEPQIDVLIIYKCGVGFSRVVCLLFELLNFIVDYFADHPIHPPARTSRPYDLEIPVDSGHVFRMEKGAYEVFASEEAMQRDDKALFHGISRDEWWADYHTMWLMMLDGPL